MLSRICKYPFLFRDNNRSQKPMILHRVLHTIWSILCRSPIDAVNAVT